MLSICTVGHLSRVLQRHVLTEDAICISNPDLCPVLQSCILNCLQDRPLDAHFFLPFHLKPLLYLTESCTILYVVIQTTNLEVILNSYLLLNQINHPVLFIYLPCISLVSLLLSNPIVTSLKLQPLPLGTVAIPSPTSL